MNDPYENDMTKEEKWWEDFFSGTWRDISRLTTEGKTGPEATTIESLLEVAPGARLLDVPCGGGRHALELVSRGYSVTGVDVSASEIAEARRQGRGLGPELELVQCDMRELPWTERFDGAYCYWGSFGYFDEEGNRAFVAAVARALKPGARFLIETQCLETVLPRFELKGSSSLGELVLMEERRYDHETGRIHSQWEVVDDGVKWRRESSIRIYSYREIASMMTECGLTGIEGFDPLAGGPFALGSRRLGIVGRKG